MPAQVYGIEHIIYLLVFFFVLALLIFISKKYLNTEKEQTIFIKSLSATLLLTIVASRISEGVVEGIQYIIPNSFCGMTSLLFSIFTLFGKKNNIVYHCIWYLAIAGGFITLAYPDYISDGPTIFYPPTFFSLLHHSFSVYLAVTIIIFKWFTPTLDRTYIFTLGVAIYIIFGYFDQIVLKAKSSMCINEPLLSGTPFNCYFVLGVGSVLVILFNIFLNIIRKNKRVKSSTI